MVGTGVENNEVLTLVLLLHPLPSVTVTSVVRADFTKIVCDVSPEDQE
jgi:hypothetical protein